MAKDKRGCGPQQVASLSHDWLGLHLVHIKPSVLRELTVSGSPALKYGIG